MLRQRGPMLDPPPEGHEIALTSGPEFCVSNELAPAPAVT